MSRLSGYEISEFPFDIPNISFYIEIQKDVSNAKGFYRKVTWVHDIYTKLRNLVM